MNVIVHFTCSSKRSAIFNGDGGVTVLYAERSTISDQGGAAVQNSIARVAVLAGEGQGV